MSKRQTWTEKRQQINSVVTQSFLPLQNHSFYLGIIKPEATCLQGEKGYLKTFFFFFAATLENEIEAREAVKQALTHMGSFPYSEPFCHKKKITKTKSPQNHIAQNVNSAALERDLEKLHTEK